jgi:hypothetical protein
LNSEQEGVDTMRGINKILLENILPAHVAEHYLLRAQGVAGVLRDTNVSFVVGLFKLSFALVRSEAFMSSVVKYVAYYLFSAHYYIS